MTLRIRDSIGHKQNKCAPSLVRSIPSAVQAEYTVSIFHLTNGIYTTYLYFLPDILYPYCWPLRRLRAHLAFLPRVADTNCEPCAVLIEFDRRNRRVVFRVLSQPLLGLVVPDRHRSVRARRCKGTITESQRSLVSFRSPAKKAQRQGTGAYTGWNASALTGHTWSTSSTVCRWHLNAYFLSWVWGLGSKYSTAIRPSTEPVAYPVDHLSSTPFFQQ